MQGSLATLEVGGDRGESGGMDSPLETQKRELPIVLSFSTVIFVVIHFYTWRRFRIWRAYRRGSPLLCMYIYIYV